LESIKKDLVFDLREEGNVTIPVEEYKRLVSSDERLQILQKMRIHDVMTKSYASRETQDYVLGDAVQEAWEIKEKGGAMPDD
jgi:hypothetical protein